MNLLLKNTLLLATAFLSAAPTLAQTAPPPPPRPPADARQPPPAPETLTAAQIAKVKSVLAPYKANALTAEDAKAIKRALRDAGMRRSPALDAAIAANGFSAERLEALDPRPPAGASAPRR